MNFPLILQLDVTGIPISWITYETSAYHYAKDNVAWVMGETEFTIRGGINAITNKQSTLTINTIIALKGKLGTTKEAFLNHAPLNNKILFKRDRNICAYCGNRFSSSILTRDHVVPISRGGKDEWMNVVTSCPSCNHKKGNRLLEEIPDMDLLYVPYIPNRAEWLLLMNRKILADQMDFLIKKVPKSSRLLE